MNGDAGSESRQALVAQEIKPMSLKAMAGASSLSTERFSAGLAPAPGVADRLMPGVSVDGVDPRLVSLVAPDSAEAEQYRVLRSAVESIRSGNEGAVVGVCSPVAGDGKSITAINLAGALAQDPKASVLLVEADLRERGVPFEDRLPLGNVAGRGLVDAILDLSVCLDEAVQYLAYFNLSVLPAGRRFGAPYEALKSPRFGELLEQARRRYDYVILDTPAVVAVADCRLLVRWVDSFIMVVAADRTPREAVEEALTIMGPESIAGLVFNGHDRSAMRRHGYGYGRAAVRGRAHWWNRLWKRGC